MDIYSESMKELASVCGFRADIYESVKPVKSCRKIKPLTDKQRELVDSLSTERGYRAFTADRMGL